MIREIRKTIIAAPIESVSHWFKTVLPYNYQLIHPIDHLELTQLGKGRIQTGSVFRLREKIGGRFYLSTKIRVTELSDTSFSFIGLFPYSLVNLRARFSLHEKDKKTTEVTAENYGGIQIPILGEIFDKIIFFFLPLQVLRQHMLEENIGIKNAVELSVSQES